ATARLGLTATPPRGAALTLLTGMIGPTVFELAIGDLAGGFLASFDAITFYLDLGPEERATYSSLSAVFSGAFEKFHRLAPEADWADFVRAAAGTAEGRRALAAGRPAERRPG